ncbi:MAG: rhomboid family intramembrane serine protease [Bifidobacteriaceae bacterium]|jgi:membrane associated rhomboid family serine protease|nr:rhomboid family intramembrane serine protease [Bifidobacteriaceae bacterium]
MISLCVAVAAVGWFAPALSVTEHLGFVPILARAEPWRLVTSIFDHAGLAHLALNMLCLWMVGSFLEPMLGRWRYAALYLVSGLGGGLLILAWARWTGPSVEWVQLTVGASGAIFGMFGAMVWVVRRLGGNLRGILVVLAINIVFTLTNSGTVSWQGHFGGLIVGLVLGAVYAFAPRGRHRVYSIIATVGVAVLVLGTYVALSTGLPTTDAITSQIWG